MDLLFKWAISDVAKTDTDSKILYAFFMRFEIKWSRGVRIDIWDKK